MGLGTLSEWFFKLQLRKELYMEGRLRDTICVAEIYDMNKTDINLGPCVRVGCNNGPACLCKSTQDCEEQSHISPWARQRSA